jgi:hypothetical protein
VGIAAKQWLRVERLVTLGYSGGAIPGSHLSSLFVERLKHRRPITNAR